MRNRGLTRTSDSYKEAIKCLKERYDCPRCVLEEHIRSIVDAAPVKNDSEMEIRRLYDAATQHYHSLKEAKADSFETLLTVNLTIKSQAVGKGFTDGLRLSYVTCTDDTFLACKKSGHEVHICSEFKGWMYADRISAAQELGLCINCLRNGRIAEKCRAPPMCKKCTRNHHTLLHRNADSVPQEKPKRDDKVEETHARSGSNHERTSATDDL